MPSKNPFLVRGEAEARTGVAYKHSRKQERAAAKDVGGRLIPASGAKFRKGDAEVPRLVRIECKATEADSFRVTKGMFAKVDAAAMLSDQVPYIEIEFVNNVGKPIETYCVVRRNDMVSLLRRVSDGENLGPAGDSGVGRVKPDNRRLAPPPHKK